MKDRSRKVKEVQESQRDPLGLDCGMRKNIVRRIVVGGVAAAVTLTPLVVFGCTVKFR